MTVSGSVVRDMDGASSVPGALMLVGGKKICIYIYTHVKPGITCTKQGGTDKKLMPIIDSEPAFFEWPFPTQATNAPRGSGRERHF